MTRLRDRFHVRGVFWREFLRFGVLNIPLWTEPIFMACWSFFFLLWGPGRHCAGDNTFSYFLDPSGNTMEYTTELEELDEDTWHPHIYDLTDPQVQDQWGTARRGEEPAADA